MTTQLKNLLKYTLALEVGGFLFLFALKDSDFPQMEKDIRQADFSWILITILIAILSHLARAARWNLLLKPLGYSPKIINTFMAVMVGYFANILIPRLGEVSRCAVLNKLENTHFNSTFGTVITERVFDLICLMALVGFSFLMEYQRFSDLFLNYLNSHSNTGNHFFAYYILATGFLLIIATLLLFRKKIIKSTLFSKVKQFVLGIIEGALSISQLSNKDKALFLLHTFLIWFGYYLMTYLAFFSLPYTSGLSPLAGLVILIVASLAMAMPVQGGLGAFEWLVPAALIGFYSLAEDQGKTYTIIIHASQFITVILVGGICALIVLFHKRKVEATVPQTT